MFEYISNKDNYDPLIIRQIEHDLNLYNYDSINNDIYLCRDRLGIKPLFWCYKNGTLYWSSEIKSIKSVVPISIDHMRTLHSLAISADESRTRILFSDVNILSPGTYLKCKLGGKPEIKIYYDLINDIDKDMYNELNRLPEDQIKICLTEKFKSSVESMLMSDVPLGTFVSGGIDSSIIASIGNETNDMNLFTSDVADENSELQYAKYLSNHLGKKLFVSKYTPDHWIEDMINCTYHYETPITTHINALPFSRVAELSNQHGVKPVLTGEGADELFIGYPYVILDRFKNILLLPINIMTSFYNIIPRLKKHLIPDSDVIPRFLIEELLIRNERKVLREKLIDAYSFVNKKNMDWTVKTGEDLSFHLHTLLHRNDRMGMMYSIESRFPFLDEEIIKFGLNLPVKWKIKYSLSHFDKYHPFIKDKYIIRQIASDVLPNKIANRPLY